MKRWNKKKGKHPFEQENGMVIDHSPAYPIQSNGEAERQIQELCRFTSKVLSER